MNRTWFKQGYGFNKYDPEFYSKWGLNEHDFVLLIGKLKLWFILHPDEDYYCEHCRLHNEYCNSNTQITCTYGKNKQRAFFCLTWLREENYVN